jgi:hypothetical protein
MEYQLNKYTTISYVQDGLEVFDRILVDPVDTPEVHDEKVRNFVEQTYAVFGILSYTIETRYIYDAVGGYGA